MSIETSLTALEAALQHSSVRSMSPEVRVEDSELDSVSEVDLEPVNGGRRESDWRDARKARVAEEAQFNASSKPKTKPSLEDGAD